LINEGKEGIGKDIEGTVRRRAALPERGMGEGLLAKESGERKVISKNERKE